ncbi:hypothetical protein TNCT_394701 [Trichonephila clavata]|uniref:Uncharacterized protein n=1 Tax=Trichonephila clavata TaxID=2740835 RepID=A0A8X6KRF0_TRICU|nr:hypothetical protein TNCT_394701 [Trichonephila clavata]
MGAAVKIKQQLSCKSDPKSGRFLGKSDKLDFALLQESSPKLDFKQFVTNHTVTSRKHLPVIVLDICSVSRLFWGCFCSLSPMSGIACTSASPPVVHVRVGFMVGWSMQHSTHPAPEVGVDEFPSTFPAEILIVQSVVLIQYAEIFGQFLRGSEVINVDVRVGWGSSCIIFWPTSHNNGHNVATEKEKKG